MARRVASKQCGFTHILVANSAFAAFRDSALLRCSVGTTAVKEAQSPILLNSDSMVIGGCVQCDRKVVRVCVIGGCGL